MANSPDWTPLHAQIHRTVRQRQLFQQQQHLLVAVSGGQDSLCLAQLLQDLRPQWQWQLAIAHCDHGWRSDSTANADYVESLAQQWQLPHYRMTTIAPLSSEAAARQWRYQALAQIALTHGYSHIVTGHTASDRAETLLYNLMRGSGTDGLQALAWTRELAPGLRLVRPLLEVTRAETAQFCDDRALIPWEDSTNQDWDYARNRIRQELLPYLKTHFNPQVESALTQTAELLRAEVEYLEEQATALAKQAIASEETALEAPLTAHLNRPLLQTAPLALQRRVVRQFLQQRLPVAPTFEHIEKLTALITAPNRSQTDPFPGGAIAQVEGEWICLRLPQRHAETH